MGNICVISNNPLVLAKYGACAKPVHGGVAAVFASARDLVHQGAKLINHPLCGSVKPNHSPYKSLVLSAAAGGALDFKSLALMEDARTTLDKLPLRNQDFSERVHEDFQVIDLDLLEAALNALPAEYHL